jgi:hypothetical protein
MLFLYHWLRKFNGETMVPCLRYHIPLRPYFLRDDSSTISDVRYHILKRLWIFSIDHPPLQTH